MNIHILRRFEQFHQELGSLDPAQWSLKEIDDAREALLTEIEARHFHFKVLGQAIHDPRPRPVPAPPHIRQLIGAVVYRNLYRHRYTLPVEQAESYLGFAKAALGRADVDAASQAVERVLRLDPLNAQAKTLLEVIGARAAGELASRLRKRFHFRHLRSFGHKTLNVPIRLAVHAKSGSILVSDMESPHIAVFSFSGRLKTMFNQNLSTALGLAADGEDTFWVCDLGNQRVIRFDMKGRVIETIAVRSKDAALGERMPGVVQRLGKNRLALLAADKSLEHIWLGELTPAGFVQSPDLPEVVLFMKVIDGKPVFRGHNTGRLYCQDSLDAAPRVIPLQVPRLTPNYGFTPSPQGWFMDFSGNVLAKFTPQGALDFTVDLAAAFGKNTYTMDMEAFTHAGRDLLCVADVGNKCVHLFEISGNTAQGD